jgi:hypothetical protein
LLLAVELLHSAKSVLGRLASDRATAFAAFSRLSGEQGDFSGDQVLIMP